MSSIDKLFTYYDKLITPLSTGEQALISAVILIFLLWQIWMIFKSGHWIFIAILILCLPGTVPAVKNIAEIIWMVIKFLFVRTQVLMG